MKKYEFDLFIGMFLTLFGVILLCKIMLSSILSWIVIIIGKLIILLSIMEYIDCKRMIRGEDLSKDNKFKKIIRKIREKRY